MATPREHFQELWGKLKSPPGNARRFVGIKKVYYTTNDGYAVMFL